MATTYTKEDDTKVRITKTIPATEEVEVRDIGEVKRERDEQVRERDRLQAESDAKLLALNGKIAELNAIITEAEKVGVLVADVAVEVV